uniref:Uncharacterized protein n=1 Tax=Esox lucius TaxID=8010 RepID=A0A3P8XAP5_ESOLU
MMINGCTRVQPSFPVDPPGSSTMPQLEGTMASKGWRFPKYPSQAAPLNPQALPFNGGYFTYDIRGQNLLDPDLQPSWRPSNGSLLNGRNVVVRTQIAEREGSLQTPGVYRRPENMTISPEGNSDGQDAPMKQGFTLYTRSKSSPTTGPGTIAAPVAVWKQAPVGGVSRSPQCEAPVDLGLYGHRAPPCCAELGCTAEHPYHPSVYEEEWTYSPGPKYSPHYPPRSFLQAKGPNSADRLEERLAERESLGHSADRLEERLALNGLLVEGYHSPSPNRAAQPVQSRFPTFMDPTYPGYTCPPAPPSQLGHSVLGSSPSTSDQCQRLQIPSKLSAYHSLHPSHFLSKPTYHGLVSSHLSHSPTSVHHSVRVSPRAYPNVSPPTSKSNPLSVTQRPPFYTPQADVDDERETGAPGCKEFNLSTSVEGPDNHRNTDDPPASKHTRLPSSTQTGHHLTPPTKTGYHLTPPTKTGYHLAPPTKTGYHLAPPSHAGYHLAPPTKAGHPLALPSQAGYHLNPPTQAGHHLAPPTQVGQHLAPPTQAGHYLVSQPQVPSHHPFLSYLQLYRMHLSTAGQVGSPAPAQRRSCSPSPSSSSGHNQDEPPPSCIQHSDRPLDTDRPLDYSLPQYRTPVTSTQTPSPRTPHLSWGYSDSPLPRAPGASLTASTTKSRDNYGNHYSTKCPAAADCCTRPHHHNTTRAAGSSSLCQGQNGLSAFQANGNGEASASRALKRCLSRSDTPVTLDLPSPKRNQDNGDDVIDVELCQKRPKMDTNGERGCTEMNGERGCTETNGERGRTETNEERGRTETNGERGRTETNGERGRTETNRERGRTETNGERGRTETIGERGRTETNGERGRTETNGERGRTETNGERGRTETNGQCGRTETNGERGRSDSQSPCSPPMPVINNVFSLAPYKVYLQAAGMLPPSTTVLHRTSQVKQPTGECLVKPEPLRQPETHLQETALKVEEEKPISVSHRIDYHVAPSASSKHPRHVAEQIILRPVVLSEQRILGPLFSVTPERILQEGSRRLKIEPQVSPEEALKVETKAVKEEVLAAADTCASVGDLNVVVIKKCESDDLDSESSLTSDGKALSRSATEVFRCKASNGSVSDNMTDHQNLPNHHQQSKAVTPHPRPSTPPQPPEQATARATKLNLQNIPPQSLKLSTYTIVLPDSMLPTHTTPLAQHGREIVPQSPTDPVSVAKSSPSPPALSDGVPSFRPARQHFLELHLSLCKLVSCCVSRTPPTELRVWLSQLDPTAISPPAKVQKVTSLLGADARAVWLRRPKTQDGHGENQEEPDPDAALQKVLQRLREYIAQQQCPFPHVMRAGTVFVPMLVVKELLFPQVQGYYIDQVLQEHKVELRPTTLTEERHLVSLQKRPYSSKLRRLLSLKHLLNIYPDVLNLYYHACVCKSLEWPSSDAPVKPAQASDRLFASYSLLMLTELMLVLSLIRLPA